MEVPDYPDYWRRGQLIDLKRFNDGSFKAYLLGDCIEKPKYVDFSNSADAQAFISWWYAPASVIAKERECQEPVPPDAPASTPPRSPRRYVRRSSKGKA